MTTEVLETVGDDFPSDTDNSEVEWPEEFFRRAGNHFSVETINRTVETVSPEDMLQRGFQVEIIKHLLRSPEMVAERKNIKGSDFWNPLHQMMFNAAHYLDRFTETPVPIPFETLKVPLERMKQGGIILTEEWTPLLEECETVYAGDLNPHLYKSLLSDFFARIQTRRIMRKEGLGLEKIYNPDELRKKLIEIQCKLPHAKTRLTVRKPSDVLRMSFSPDDKLLENGYLTKGESLLICGAPGLGKSRISRQLAIDCIVGREFLGMATNAQNTRWLIIQMEDSNQRLQADLAAMLGDLTEEERERVDDHLLIHTLENDHDGMLQIGAMMRDGKRDMTAQTAIAALIQENNPDVVIFDCFARFAAGNLNDDQEMAFVASELLRLTRQGNPKRIPIFVHHAKPGREGAAGAVGYNRGVHGRNSRVLLGIVRAQINLAPGSGDNNNTLIVSSGKLNNGIEFAPFAATLNQTTLTYHCDPRFDLTSWQAEVCGQIQGRRRTVEDLLACIPETGSVEKQELKNVIAPSNGIGMGKAAALLSQLLREQPPRVFEHSVPRPNGPAQLFISRTPPEPASNPQ